ELFVGLDSPVGTKVETATRASSPQRRPIIPDMRYAVAISLFVAACAASGSPTEAAAPITVLDGAYEAVSINGQSLPAVTASPDSAKHEIIAERLWLGGSAGRNGAMRRIVSRTTRPSGVTIDSATFTGTFYPSRATAETSFGTVTANGARLELDGKDGSVRMYARVN